MLSIVNNNNTKLVAPVPGGVDLVGVDEVEDHPEGVGRVNVGINRFGSSSGCICEYLQNNSTIHTVLYYFELYQFIFYCMYFLYCNVAFFLIIYLNPFLPAPSSR